jgi:hypothetical protein
MKFINNLQQGRQIHLHVWNMLKQPNNIKKTYNENTEDTTCYMYLYEWKVVSFSHIFRRDVIVVKSNHN